MKIEITDHRKIFTVQRAFSDLFPFLKIEFFAKPHTSGGASSEKLIRHSSKTLGTCRTIHKKGSIHITPEMTVRELGQTFSDVYGLAIQVSRISGTNWVDTADTANWSLKKQNKEGQQSVVLQEIN